MGNSIQRPVARFEDFEVNLETGEVWKAGRPLKVQDQPFKVLAALLERPGQIVSREELRQLIWPDKNFGDFDHAINLALAKLRATLGDSADVPHLIETLPRRGYRFIAPLKDLSDQLAGRTAIALNEKPDPSSAEAHSSTSPGKKLWLIFGALPLFLLAAVALLRLFPAHPQQSPAAGEMVPLVSTPGHQKEPAVSPDGSQVAFHYDGAPHPGIYIAMVGGERPLQLTENAADSFPVWSPDGRQIAFARFHDSLHRMSAGADKQKDLYVIPALGGSARRVYTAPYPHWPNCNSMDWSPDGKSLIFPEALGDGVRVRLSLLSLSDLTARPLTSPTNQESDCDPVFSPDGATIAFTRGPIGGIASDLFVMKVAGGQRLRLTTGDSGGHPAWTQDGTEIVYESPARGVQSLWRIPAAGGTPQRVAGAGADAYIPSISRRGNQLAYEVYSRLETIWRLDLKDERHALAPPVRLLTGRGGTWRPSYSPDGNKIAFESNRMGYSDIWMCDSDGSNCVQLTSLHGISGTARWSPNGRYIAFESIAKDYYHVGVIEVPDGTAHMLATFPDANSGAPSWSSDSKSIYFYSGHDPGSFQLWKMPLQGGSPVRVTTRGGVYGIESSDGQFLYYAKYAEPGIWKKSLKTGYESYLPINVYYWAHWALAPGGVYFLNSRFSPYGRIEFFDFVTGQSTPIFTFERPFAFIGGLALSPDRKSLLFGQNERNDSDIMLIKDFH